ncbi:SgcJ/EcaC family oxidoreductase [Nocardia sp. NPDC055165]|uniref:SgcJ/EcaC family oxidoreductase n=1 Tax=Nocardia sp. NPDC060220 TaxID=3347076 RepID=UPI0036517789
MTDETAILALLREQMDAWAAGDGTSFAAPFTRDADFVSVIGERIQGRTELATVMQEGFDGFMRRTRMAEPETTTLRFPAPNVARASAPAYLATRFTCQWWLGRWETASAATRTTNGRTWWRYESWARRSQAWWTRRRRPTRRWL